MNSNLTNTMDRTVNQSDLECLLRAGLIDQALYDKSLQQSGILPDKASWRNFLQIFLAAVGTLFLLSGIIFFFAFNWNAMSKWHKFAVIQLALLLTGLFVYWRGVDGLPGKLALMVLAGLIGVLFAVFGQLYQTGADAWELFFYWSLLVLPLAILARFAPLWLFWLALVNIAMLLYLKQNLDYRENFILQLQFVLNAAFLLTWEYASFKRVTWLQEYWSIRLVFAACLALASILIAVAINSIRISGGLYSMTNLVNLVIYTIVLAASFGWYQRVRHDLFVMALTLLSLGWASVNLYLTFRIGTRFGSLLVLSLLIIAESAVAVIWLRKKQIQWQVHS